MKAPTVGRTPEDVLPELATAFNEDAMRGCLQTALFSDRATHTVERATPTRPLYVPGECLVLRYRFRAREIASGEVVEPIVTGRVFPDRSSCKAYMSDKLAPLAARMRGRPEVAAFAAPAAVVEPLNMVVHVWPIDGELPTLVEATDRAQMLELFRETLPFAVENCRIELASYRRRQRCALRYTIEGRDADSDEPRSLVAYGKVTGAGTTTLASPLIDVVRRRLEQSRAPHRLTAPRLLAWRSDLQLALLEALPGEAHVRLAVKARLRGRSTAETPPLEEMVDTCAHAAATLHASGLVFGPVRAFDDELAGLAREVAVARQFVPRFGGWADSVLERIAALAAESDPLELGLGHGDFNHGQLLFDAASAALLDLDTLCQAEPALDLGTFLAHLRAETEGLRRRASVSSSLAEELAERFLSTYVSAAGEPIADEERLRARTKLYEALALVRLAVRSQHGFEETRLEIATGLLEERMSSAADRPRS